MKVEVATFIASMGGSLDEHHYMRQIPGKPGWASYCEKPKFSKKHKATVKASMGVRNFTEVTAQAQEIYRDAARKAEWADRHQAALREASRHQKQGENGKPAVPVRLWDYVRKELSKSKKQ